MVEYNEDKPAERYMVLLDQNLGAKPLSEKLVFYSALVEIFKEGQGIVGEIRELCERKVGQLEEAMQGSLGC